MRPKARCRRRASCSARRSPAGFLRSSSSTRSTVPTRGRPRCSTRFSISSSISTPRKRSSIFRSSTPTAGSERRRSIWTNRAKIFGRCSTPSCEHVPPPMGSLDAPLQLLVANLDSSDYLGRIAIGRIFNGRVKIGDEIAICTPASEARKAKVTKLYSFDGLKRIDIDNAAAGDIVCLAGIPDITIGETVTEVERQMPVPDDRGGRADGVDDFRRQHVADGGPRRAVRHVAAGARSPRARADRQRVDSAREHRQPRNREGGRPRRAAAVDPHRDDAARRVRAAGVDGRKSSRRR